MYKISLSNGKVIENLELNGNNYIANAVIDKSIFENGLNEVAITDEYDRNQILNDVKLIHFDVNKKAKTTRFVIREKTKEEKEFEKINNSVSASDNNITDIQLALAELFELFTGGLLK